MILKSESDFLVSLQTEADSSAAVNVDQDCRFEQQFLSP